jgi:hypothetical protein
MWMLNAVELKHSYWPAEIRVGQNHIYTVYIRYFWQENHQLYGHIRCKYTVLANPSWNEYAVTWSKATKLLNSLCHHVKARLLACWNEYAVTLKHGYRIAEFFMPSCRSKATDLLKCKCWSKADILAESFMPSCRSKATDLKKCRASSATAAGSSCGPKWDRLGNLRGKWTLSR